MGFRKDNWASVWSIEDGKNNSKRVRLSTSKKNKLTGEYEQDFSAICFFYKTAAFKISTIRPGDRIKLTDINVRTWVNNETNKEYVVYQVFDFEKAVGAGIDNLFADIPSNGMLSFRNWNGFLNSTKTDLKTYGNL